MIKTIKKFFLMVFGAAVGLVLSAIAAGFLKLEGPIAIGAMAFGIIFGSAIAGRIAKSTHKATEEAVHGHPIRTFFLWLFMLIILGGAILIFGSMAMR